MALLVGTAAWIVANDDGTGQSGSVWDAAWVAAAAASIDAVLQSATNPGVTPAALIDEVVAARGSKLTLDARLDIALNEDGTLKTIAGQATNTDLQAILQSRNVALNGNLEDWTLGGALAPDNYVLSGAAGTIARTGPAMADTFTFGTGTYAAKLTRAGTNVKLLQSVISAGEMPAAADIKGKKIGVLVMGKTAIANHLRIIVDDGVLTTASAYHTGGGTAEALTVLHTLSAAATKLEVYASEESSNGDAYVGGFTFVFSNLAPTRWLPLDTTPVANANHGGTLSFAAQEIPAQKQFILAPQFRPGGSSVADATVSGRVSSNTTAVGNFGGGTDNLMADTIKGNWLSADGKAYRYTASGIGANNANNKLITVLLDGNTILNTGNFTTEWTSGWELSVIVIRTTTTTCKVFVRFSAFGSASGVRATYTSVTVANWTADRILQVQGAATADNDIVQHMGVGEVLG